MGQRMQYIIKYPEYFLNEGNPNNYNEGFYIIHNQWSYGIGAINRLNKYLNKIQEVKDYYIKEGNKPNEVDWRELINNIIRSINYGSVIYPENNTLSYDSNNKEDELFFKNNKSFEEMFTHLDNNNGFILIDIGSMDEKIKYSIVNGSEDHDIIRQREIEEYILLVEGEEKFKELQNDDEYYKIINSIVDNNEEVLIDHFNRSLRRLFKPDFESMTKEELIEYIKKIEGVDSNE